jgi:hypothetical protein
MTSKQAIEALADLKQISEVATEDELGRALIVALDELVEGDDGIKDLDGYTILNYLAEMEVGTEYFRRKNE